jgi:hypothetical protein
VWTSFLLYRVFFRKGSPAGKNMRWALSNTFSQCCGSGQIFLPGTLSDFSNHANRDPFPYKFCPKYFQIFGLNVRIRIRKTVFNTLLTCDFNILRTFLNINSVSFLTGTSITNVFNTCMKTVTLAGQRCVPLTTAPLAAQLALL